MRSNDAQDKQTAQAPDAFELDRRATMENEKLFFDDSELQEGGRIEPALLPDTPSFRETLALYLFSGVLLLVLGAGLQHFHLFSGLIVSQIAFIAGPAYAFTRLGGYNVSRTFSFVPVRLRTALPVLFIACSAFALVGIIAVLQESLFPRSAEYAAAWEGILLKFQEAPPALILFLVSILPGVCEELLFRGFLLHGVRKKFADVPAVIFVGALFGLFHLDVYRFLPVSLLGMLFGYIVVKTGSIFPAMLAHSANNAITIFLSYAASFFQGAEPLAAPAQFDGLLSLQGILSVSAIAATAALILRAALHALPDAPHDA